MYQVNQKSSQRSHQSIVIFEQTIKLEQVRLTFMQGRQRLY